MKTKLKIIIIIFLLITIFIFEIYGDQIVYLPYRGNYQMTGVYNTKGVPVLHGIKWKIPIDVAHTPIVWNNNIYLTSGNCLYCIDPKTGNIIWKTKPNEKLGIGWTSVIIEDNIIICSADEKILESMSSGYSSVSAFDAFTGKLIWYWSSGMIGEFQTYPIAYKGIVFIKICYFSEFPTDNRNFIVAIDIKKGKELYKYSAKIAKSDDETNLGNISNPVLYKGKIYYVKDSALYYVDPERYDKEVFLFKVADNARYITIEDDCLIFGNIYLYAYDLKTKKLRWMFKKIFEDGDYTSFDNSLVSIYDGKVFIGGNNFKKDGYISMRENMIYAIDINDGKLLWETSNISAASSIAEGIIYDTKRNVLCAVNCTNGEIIWKYELSKSLNSHVLIYDGMIYFGCRDGYFYALY